MKKFLKIFGRHLCGLFGLALIIGLLVALGCGIGRLVSLTGLGGVWADALTLGLLWAVIALAMSILEVVWESR